MSRSVPLRATLSAALAAVLISLASVVVLTGPAQAATLTQVTGFGSNPGALQMYSYRPDGLPAGAPLVVALHGCTQSARRLPRPRRLAEVRRPVEVRAGLSATDHRQQLRRPASPGSRPATPPAVRARRCRSSRWSTTRSRTTASTRTGSSSPGSRPAARCPRSCSPPIRTSSPAGRSSPASRTAAPPTMSSASLCQYLATSKTPAQWGDLVRAANPGYAGPWPRVSIWYGTSDTTVIPANGTQLRDQWTNVWGIAQTSGGTSTLPGGTTRDVYLDGTGAPAVTLYKVQGISHGTPVDPGSGHRPVRHRRHVLPRLDLRGVLRRGLVRAAPGGVATVARPRRRRPPRPPRRRRPRRPLRRRPRPLRAPGRASPPATTPRCRPAGRTSRWARPTPTGRTRRWGCGTCYVTHTLRQTGTNYYVLADGQC